MSPTNGEEQDAQDMARLARGQDTALNALMDRHGERLFHYLLRSLQNDEDAADLAQETFVRIYQNRAEFDPRQKFSTWLYTIANNLVRNRFRWRSRHPQVSLDADTAPGEDGWVHSLPAPEAPPDQAAQSRESAGAVKEAVAALPDELREPLLLAVYEGFAQAEIAVILGCTAKAVETRIYRARQQLRAALNVAD